jgi:hypothetical protein
MRISDKRVLITTIRELTPFQYNVLYKYLSRPDGAMKRILEENKKARVCIISNWNRPIAWAVLNKMSYHGEAEIHTFTAVRYRNRGLGAFTVKKLLESSSGISTLYYWRAATGFYKPIFESLNLHCILISYN